MIKKNIHGHNIATPRFIKQLLNDMRKDVGCSEGLKYQHFNNG